MEGIRDTIEERQSSGVCTNREACTRLELGSARCLWTIQVQHDLRVRECGAL
ncbi:hypothetical protein COCNU_04G003630 [Cocos nucifera]|uniref:Uncharacterized protein n=1 Tax=Cocos nucifera TaxID=13894 RepID=A0A8K0I5V5_COCNU|nr:hypothetical protein COCNU_04G003630 [Cocos nucifera]